MANFILCGERTDSNEYSQKEMFREPGAKSFIAPYAIAHEGKIRPSMMDRFGAVFAAMFSFTERAVRKTYERIENGIIAYDNHDPEKMHTGQHRPEIARTIGRAMTMLNGKAHAVAFLEFDSEETARQFPRISMENKGFFTEGYSDRVIDVGPISGLGLLRKGIAPAFSGAAILCNYAGEGGTPMTFPAAGRLPSLEATKDAINQNGWPASRLYDSYSIIGEIEIDSEGNVRFEGGDSKIRDILIKKFKNRMLVDREAFDKLKAESAELAKIKSEYETLRTDRFKNAFREKIDQAITNRKLSKELAEFVKAPVLLDKVGFSEDIEKATENYLQEKTELFNQTIGKKESGGGNSGSSDAGKTAPPSTENLFEV